MVDSGLDSESRGDPIGTPCEGIVGVAVGVHSAEVVGGVVIRGTLPPPSSGTPESTKNPATRFYRNAPIDFTYRFLSLLRTFFKRASSRSINSPSSCDIWSNFFIASEDETFLPLAVVKQPSGLVSIIR